MKKLELTPNILRLYESEQRLSYLDIQKIFYNLSMIYLIKISFMKYFDIYGDKHQIPGKSGTPYLFGGGIYIGGLGTEPFFIECNSYNDDSFIDLTRIESILYDIDFGKCILFSPTFQSSKTRRYEFQINRRKNIHVKVLNLHHLYFMTKIWEELDEKTEKNENMWNFIENEVGVK